MAVGDRREGGLQITVDLEGAIEAGQEGLGIHVIAFPYELVQGIPAEAII